MGNKKKRKREVEKAFPAPEGFTDTHHHLTLMQLSTPTLHCYLESVCALLRKGQCEQKSFTLRKHAKDRQPSGILHFTKEGKISPGHK